MGLLMTILPFLKGKQNSFPEENSKIDPWLPIQYLQGSDVVGKALRNLREQFKLGHLFWA